MVVGALDLVRAVRPTAVAENRPSVGVAEGGPLFELLS